MNKFKGFKKEKTILDCFTYNLKAFFHDQYEEIESEETPATVMMVYEKKLDWHEIDIFNIIQFRVFFDKENLTGSNPINVKFLSKDKNSSINKLEEIINRIFSIYGEDDMLNGEWTENDITNYNNDSYRRIWTIESGESFVSVEYNKKDGITLNILFFNNILNPPETNEESIDDSDKI